MSASHGGYLEPEFLVCGDDCYNKGTILFYPLCDDPNTTVFKTETHISVFDIDKFRQFVMNMKEGKDCIFGFNIADVYTGDIPRKAPDFEKRVEALGYDTIVFKNGVTTMSCWDYGKLYERVTHSNPTHCIKQFDFFLEILEGSRHYFKTE